MIVVTCACTWQGSVDFARGRAPRCPACRRPLSRPVLTVAQLLDFEASHTGIHKEEAIRDDLNITPARYYQLLFRAIDTREALEHDPELTRRLIRQRDKARTARVTH